MIIKVILLTIVLVFLVFFPALYTFFYYYRKNGGYTEEATENAVRAFGLTITIGMIILIIISFSCNVIYGFR